MPARSEADQLKQLVKLQSIHIKIKALQERTQTIPIEIEMIQADTRRYEEEIEQAKKFERSLESQYRSYENEIEDRAAKLDQYQAQLLTVKTNIEYASLLKQIDAIKRMNEDTNEQIFHLEEERERLQEERAEKERMFARVKAENDRKISEKTAALKESEKELSDLRKREAAIKSKISPDLLAKYERIAEAREGIAVVSANDGICQGCFTSIRPKVFDEIRRGGTIVQCESCSRILYYDQG